jgi:hypothetical protein
MSENIARCGYRCDLCPAHKNNIHSSADQQRVSDGWFKHYGFRIPFEQILCDGCRDTRPDAKRIDTNCEVRSCTIERNFDTCADCREYACEKLSAKIVSRSWVESRVGAPISEVDYKTYVQPYEADKVLNHIRSGRGK